MAKSPSIERQGYPCPPGKTTKRPAKTQGRRRRPAKKLIYQLASLGEGMGLTAAAAFLSWGTSFGIDTNWSMTQMAENAQKCDRKTISNAMDSMLAEGYVVKLTEHVYNGFKKPGNRRAVYRFTESFYALIGKARQQSKKREKFPMPLVFSVPISDVPSHVQHQHQAPTDGHAVKSKKPLGEDLAVVETLVKVGKLDEQGAKAAAKAIPTAMKGEALPFLLQAALAVVESRKATIRKTPQALLYHLLTSRDHLVYTTGEKIYQQSKKRIAEGWRKETREAWSKTPEAFRVTAGATETLQAWMDARKACLTNRPSDFVLDQKAETTRQLVQLICAALDLPPCPENSSLLDRRKWSHQVLVAGGLGDYV